MKSIKIKVDKDEQITPQFMDLFSKVIISSAQSISGLHYDQLVEMKYCQLSEYLFNSSFLKHNGMKSPNPKLNQSLSFDFEGKTNNIVFLLDLSPYMLVYNFGSKSFPLKNLQEIIIFLLKSIAFRQAKLPDHEFIVTIYFFSIYRKELEIILINERITPNMIDQLVQYINLSIQKSNLPYLKQLQNYGISQLLQNVFNQQQTTIGVKCIIVVSSFNQEQHNRMMLFTPNWYTYAFVNTGGHFGSYVIDSKELYRNLAPGICFKTKYVFQANFLTNWQMTDIVKRQNPSITKPITEKFRSIQFESEGKVYQDIFELVLKFKIELKGFHVSKRVNGGAQSVISVISTIKDNPNKIIYKNYKIPAESIVYILRTRYMQGWEPVIISSSSMAVQNSKFKLRLAIENQRFLYYEALRVKNFFQVQIYQIVNHESGKDFAIQNERSELLALIQKMDKLSSFNFVTLINENLKINYKSKLNVLNSSLFHEKNQNQILNYLCNYREWGKFFKIRRICFKFQPQLTQSVLQQFINQTTFILGKRIYNNIFVKQKQVQKKNYEKLEQLDVANRRIMLTKLYFFGNVLQLEMGFLRCTFKEINNQAQSLNKKVNGRKFKKGITATAMPLQILLYKNNEISNRLMFNKKWVIKFKTSYYKALFKRFWSVLLKKINYEEVSHKIIQGQQNQKNFYKIGQIMNEQGKKFEKIIFLKMWEHNEKNELIFQISIPPSFTIVYPKNKQSKPIFIQDLIGYIVSGLKKTQQEAIKIIDTQLAIHHRLLKSACISQPKALSKQLQVQLNNLYVNRTFAFALDFSEACKLIIAKYYSELTKQKLTVLPLPSKFLITTELESIEGDFNLQFEGKTYNFFLCSPFKFVYLFKKDKSIYYKFVDIQYVEFNSRENDAKFIDSVLHSIIYRINEQTYMKDFKIFLGGNFKGGILKIINNQQFTHLQERAIELHPIFAHCQKYYIAQIAKGCYQEMRFAKCLQTFTIKIFDIIYQFFPLLRVNYYFQIRKKEDTGPAPFQIDTSISRNDTSLFMRFLFSTGNETSDITPQNLLELFVKHNGDIIKNNSRIIFKFYLKAKDNNQKSLVFVNYFQQTIKACINAFSHQVQRSLITKRETLIYHFQHFAFLGYMEDDFKEFQLKIIAPQFEKVETLCKYIEDPVMQNQFPFKKIRQNSNEYMLIKQQIKQKNIIYISEPFLMKPANGRLLFLFGHVSRFFVAQHQPFLQKILNNYTKVLANFINGNILMRELQMTYELPLEPYQLWLNQSANHPSNKIIIQDNKKKIKKNPIVSKYLRQKKSMVIQIENSTPSGANSSAPKIKLSMLYRDFISLNDRIPANKCLNYLGQYQIFNFNMIRNLKNTYFFEKFYQNQHIIFHFEEKEDENLIKEIMRENKDIREIKTKKFLVYYALCLNPLLSKKNIQPLILKHIQEVLQKQLFDDVARSLILNPTPIQQFEQSFIKRKETEQKKEFKVQLPTFYHRDHIIQYIIQHVQVYHYRVQFKSQIQKEKTKYQGSPQKIKLAEPTTMKFLQGIKICQNLKLQTKSRESFIQRKKSAKQEGSEFGSFYASTLQRKISNLQNTSFSTPVSSTMIKSTDSFFNDFNFQHNFQTLEPTWLFNCQRPKQSLFQKYGKCLYLLKIKVKETYNQPIQRLTWEYGRQKFYLFTVSNYKIESSQIRSFFNSRQSGKNSKKQSTKPMIKFDISEYVNKPDFAKIQETFNFIVKSCVGQAHIQNYLYEMYKGYGNEQHSLLKDQKKKALEYKDKEAFLNEKVWPSFVYMKEEFHEVLDQIDSISFFKYKSDPHLIMKDKLFYFLHFLKQFNETIKIIKNIFNEKGQLNIPILVYAKSLEKGYLFEFGNIRNINKLEEQVRLLLTNTKVVKVGFIVSDYLTTIKSSTGNPIKSSSQHDNTPQIHYTINNLRFFKDCTAKSDNNDKFKRSAIITYEISDDEFYYASYNIKSEFDEEIKDYLSAINCWLSHKSRLLSLIKNIKQNNIYEVTYSKPKVEKKLDPFYRLRRIEQNEKKQKAKLQISMYRMLVNVIFNDLPFSLKQQGNSSRYKYAHHHTQVDELIAILQDTSIDYKKYPPYKGTQKFQLQKLGREYVSILRHEYMLA